MYVTEGNNVYFQDENIKQHVSSLYHSELNYNAGVVTATVIDYFGNVYTDYAMPVTFAVDDETDIDITFTANPVGGAATMTFAADVPGTYRIRTQQLNMRNGEVVVNV